MECECGCLESHQQKLNGDDSKIIKPIKQSKPKQTEIFQKSNSKIKKKR